MSQLHVAQWQHFGATAVIGQPLLKFFESVIQPWLVSRVGVTTHDPIPEWDWPTMKMDFQVSESVDLNKIQEGDMIQFEVKKNKDFNYLIMAINKETK